QLLVRRAANALGDAAVDLAIHDHRVDHRATVFDDAVAQELEDAGLRIYLDDAGVGGVGVGAATPLVVAVGHQLRLHAGGEPDGSVVGDPRHVAQAHGARGGAPHGDLPLA